MRLSEQGLSTAEDVVRAGGRLTKDGILALIAEVRALRECERALELLIGRIPPDADPFESGDLWIGASGIIAARAALAAVRALEDKP